MGAPQFQPGKAGHSTVPGSALGLDFSAKALSSISSPLQDQGSPERGAGAKCCESKAPPQRRTCPVTQHPPRSRLRLCAGGGGHVSLEQGRPLGSPLPSEPARSCLTTPWHQRPLVQEVRGGAWPSGLFAHVLTAPHGFLTEQMWAGPTASNPPVVLLPDPQCVGLHWAYTPPLWAAPLALAGAMGTLLTWSVPVLSSWALVFPTRTLHHPDVGQGQPRLPEAESHAEATSSMGSPVLSLSHLALASNLQVWA